MPEKDIAEGAAEFLDGLEATLRAAYPRLAHRGRHDQIAQHCIGLASLIRQLPDEEEREADHSKRLLNAWDSGFLPKGPDGALISLNHDAREKLLAARRERGEDV
jgi:hypothetical protein